MSTHAQCYSELPAIFTRGARNTGKRYRRIRCQMRQVEAPGVGGRMILKLTSRLSVSPAILSFMHCSNSEGLFGPFTVTTVPCKVVRVATCWLVHPHSNIQQVTSLDCGWNPSHSYWDFHDLLQSPQEYYGVVKAEVKVFRVLTIKAYEDRGIDPLILNFGTTWRSEVTITLPAVLNPW